MQALLADFQYLIPKFQCEKVPRKHFVTMLNLWQSGLNRARAVAQRAGSGRAEIFGLKTGRTEPGPKLGGPDRTGPINFDPYRPLTDIQFDR